MIENRKVCRKAYITILDCLGRLWSEGRTDPTIMGEERLGLILNAGIAGKIEEISL